MARVTIEDPAAPGAAPMAAEDAPRTQAPVPAGWDEYRDAGGRMVVHAARRLGVRERMHFYRGLPAERQANPLWMQLAMAVACIRRVNGEPVPVPEGEREIEAMIGRVGDDIIDRINAANLARIEAEFAEIEARAKN
ncbi:conserved protein of unknown function [Rhodovastum atsumiense]|uniref:Uncharacterized protein n=1 Tax=Rhodovastum atsumiense TaxID=504468 RepID=A0A5M6IYS0_9PROT|nr:hypothetical protein [Rhodovastum atsumiense]KAA5613472.1 hypothetical protein F1189_05295 [Rhodovastum atsumiense]CAH2603211.1 conserved protein of unknown function [Rhodovastum atsumiense]